MTRTELLELLKKARKQLTKYHVPEDEQTVTLSIDMLENALKEQEARWISVPYKKARICSHCEADEPYKFADDDAEVYEYCPHCGANMTEGW